MNCNTLNAHHRDALLDFNQEAHAYWHNGKELKSVTTIVDKAFPEFNAPYWAAKKAPALGISPEELMDRWEQNARHARSLGTAMHSSIERYYLGESGIDSSDSTLSLFHDFTLHHKLNPYRIEWRIFHEEYGVAGTLDFLDYTDGKFTIWDWKRSNKIIDHTTGEVRRPGRFTSSSTHPQLGHVPDLSFYHYALQLSIYNVILQEKYGLEISVQKLGVFHPDNGKYYVVTVPFMKNEAKALLRYHL